MKQKFLTLITIIVVIICINVQSTFAYTYYMGEDEFLSSFKYSGGSSKYKTLSYGSKGSLVKELQQEINMFMGHAANSSWTPLVEDGIFGNKTKSAVKRIQSYADTMIITTNAGKTEHYYIIYAIESDGIVGPITWGKIFTVRGLAIGD
jgi:peptidoglycan hydrolase-like protein with peptidoglycan-binding domain